MPTSRREFLLAAGSLGAATTVPGAIARSAEAGGDGGEFIEFRPDTVRTMIAWWHRLAKEPQFCRDMDICEFLDRAEAETVG